MHTWVWLNICQSPFCRRCLRCNLNAPQSRVSWIRLDTKGKWDFVCAKTLKRCTISRMFGPNCVISQQTHSSMQTEYTMLKLLRIVMIMTTTWARDSPLRMESICCLTSSHWRHFTFSHLIYLTCYLIGLPFCRHI